MSSLADLPTWTLIAAFVCAAAAVWAAGTRLSRYADAIAERSGLGQALIGVLLLGGITSLPEIAVSGSAAFKGNAELSVNNLLGGFAMQVAVLALADAAIRRGALTFAVPDPIALMQGTLGILLVALTIAGIAGGDIPFAGAGLFSWAIAAVFVLAIRIVASTQHSPSWQVIGEPPSHEIEQENPAGSSSPARLAAATTGVAAVIFLAGYVLSVTSESLAERSGLGDSFFGAVFTAISTSLPEVSTVLAAVRIGRYVMAVSDIFGTNLFDIAVIFVADLLYPGGPILNETGPFAIVAGCLGITVTAIYLIGLIERSNRTIAGVGIDSLAVIATYIGGVAILYSM